MTLTKNQQTQLTISNGWLQPCLHQPSPHCSTRHNPQYCDATKTPLQKSKNSTEISLLVIHNISLPPNQFSQTSGDYNYVTDLFLGTLDTRAHPSFTDLENLQVSAHCFIRRNGDIIQYVSFDDKAWHAGVSSFKDLTACNDFSIGIELEGSDTVPYTDEQYATLTQITQQLQQHYPLIDNDHIVGHNDIAPGRKTDPGDAFDWSRYKQLLAIKN